LLLRLANDAQNAPRFVRAKLARNESGSGRDHMLCRLIKLKKRANAELA
jgi:hypothetical protein